MPKLKKYNIANVSKRHKRRIRLTNLQKIINVELINHTCDISKSHSEDIDLSASNNITGNKPSVIHVGSCTDINESDNAGTHVYDVEVEECFEQNSTDAECIIPDPINHDDRHISENPKLSLSSDISEWAVANCISHTHLDDLLKILRKHGHADHPRSSRKLLGTPRNVSLKDVNPGKYHHFGLANGILQSLQKYYLPEVCPSELKYDINIDGIPLAKSSGSQLWPILGSICADFYTEPFIIGVYHGHEKPSDFNEFLRIFVDEVKTTSLNCVLYGNKTISVSINALIFDTPARASVTGVKGHNAYFGCGKCIQEGEYVENRVTYPEINATLRTDTSFRSKLQEDHHKTISILEELNIDMVRSIPLDWMHLVCLGVMKRLVQFWVKGRKNVRIPKTNLSELTDNLLFSKQSIPKEFARKPRAIEDVDCYKATELRQLLLYTGPVIFHKYLSRDKYVYFSCLSIGIRILASREYYTIDDLREYARDLLICFVRNYSKLYGAKHISFNVHNLIHLSDDVSLRGPLDLFSTFKYENHMQKIKKQLKSSGKPLEQLVKRTVEANKVNSLYCAKKKIPIIKYSTHQTSTRIKTIKYIQFDGALLSTNEDADSCFELKDGTALKITQIYEENGQIFIRGKQYINYKPLFMDPCNSLNFRIKVVNEALHKAVSVRITEIKGKCVKLKLNDDESYILPMLHEKDVQ